MPRPGWPGFSFMSASSSPSDSSRAVSPNSDSSASTVSSAPLLDPRNDYVFKRIFAQRVDLNYGDSLLITLKCN